ncbi:hypothetical protein U1872_06890 [Sphingomonas sp. RB3P16]|uniref:hypothetical protein n=1 Tax=Parasphingomonas frigoris TaxID=3096163 RepID=UPI002FC808C4
MAIVSFKYGFVFIKTTKTAGTSLEVHLARHCDEGDIVTPILPSVDGHVPRNYSLPGGAKLYNHISAAEISASTGKLLDGFFRFCFDRHPVDKCLSHFGMLTNSPHHRSSDAPKSWSEYLDRGSFPVDAEKYVGSDGRLLVDRVFRYEQIDEALREIAMIVRIPYAPLTVRAKSGFRSGVPSVSSVLADPSARKRIFDAFQPTLQFTGY